MVFRRYGIRWGLNVQSQKRCYFFLIYENKNCLETFVAKNYIHSSEVLELGTFQIWVVNKEVLVVQLVDALATIAKETRGSNHVSILINTYLLRISNLTILIYKLLSHLYYNVLVTPSRRRFGSLEQRYIIPRFIRD